MTNKTARQILTEARALIKEQKNWCQRSLALNTRGENVSPGSSSAVQWCAEGAAIAAGRSLVSHEIRTEIYIHFQSAANKLGYTNNVSLNDGKDRDKAHELVLKMFDIAINLAQQEESTHV